MYPSSSAARFAVSNFVGFPLVSPRSVSIVGWIFVRHGPRLNGTPFCSSSVIIRRLLPEGVMSLADVGVSTQIVSHMDPAPRTCTR